MSTTLRLTVAASLCASLCLTIGSSDASAPAGRYTVTGGTVSDSKTGLTWQQNISQLKYVWASTSGETTATNYCAFLSLNGNRPWRLPTVKELLTIVDVTQKSPTIDPAAFPSTPADFFWTATPTVFLPGVIWSVSFATGLTDGTTGATNFPYYVRCVR